MKGVLSVLLIIISNVFMTFAWYGHLQFKKFDILKSAGLLSIIFISWFIAFFEYIFMIPENLIVHESQGGPFNLFQLKIIQKNYHVNRFLRMCNFYF